MVQRATYTESFKNIAMPQDTGESQAIAGLVQAGAGVLIQHQQKQDELKITKFSSQADLELLEATTKFRNETALDPMNKEAHSQLQKTYDDIFAKYDKDIGISAKGVWNKTKNELKQQYSTANGKWIIAQNIKNGERNLKEGIESSLKKGYISGLTDDYETAIQSATLKEKQLRESASGLVSASQLEDDMQNFRSDYTKSFVMGAIETNPSKAEELMKDERVIKNIDSPEAMKDLEKAVKARKKELTVIGAETQYEAQKKFIETSNDLSIAQKLTELEQGVISGRYNKTWAEAKKESMLSEKGIDAQTQNEYLNKLVMKANDLSVSFNKKGNTKTQEEYLTKLNQIATDIEKGVSQGLLSQKSAQSLYKNIYDNKTAQATKKLSKEGSWWRWGYANANTSFKNGLNDKTREAEALREYFETVNGEKYDRQRYIDITNEIIDRYNNETMNMFTGKPKETVIDEKAVKDVNALLDALGAE